MVCGTGAGEESVVVVTGTLLSRCVGDCVGGCYLGVTRC